MEIFKEII